MFFGWTKQIQFDSIWIPVCLPNLLSHQIDNQFSVNNTVDIIIFEWKPMKITTIDFKWLYNYKQTNKQDVVIIILDFLYNDVMYACVCVFSVYMATMTMIHNHWNKKNENENYFIHNTDVVLVTFLFKTWPKTLIMSMIMSMIMVNNNSDLE